MSDRVRWISRTGIGIALFVVLSLCLQVPVFENYYLCLGYAAVAVYCYCFGAASGTIVSVVGVIVYCVLIGGMRGLPGWASGNVLIGIVCGLVFNRAKEIDNRPVRIGLCVMAIVLSCAAGILGIKSAVEAFLYGQPVWARVLKNSYAFSADVAVLLASLPVCVFVEKGRKRVGL